MRSAGRQVLPKIMKNESCKCRKMANQPADYCQNQANRELYIPKNNVNEQAGTAENHAKQESLQNDNLFLFAAITVKNHTKRELPTQQNIPPSRQRLPKYPIDTIFDSKKIKKVYFLLSLL